MIIKTVAANQALQWLKKSFTLYKGNPLAWTSISFVLFILPSLLVKIFALSGYFLGDLLSSVLNIGFFRLVLSLSPSSPSIVPDSNSPQKSYDYKLLFIDFQNSDSIFTLLGMKLLLYFSYVLIFILLFLLNWYLGLAPNDYLSVIQLLSSKLYYLIAPEYYKIFALDIGILLIFFMITSAATIFAPQLIFLRKMKLVESLKASLEANFKNIGVFLNFFLLLIPIILLTVISFGVLGLITLPLFQMSLVFAFEDIFQSNNEISSPH